MTDHSDNFDPSDQAPNPPLRLAGVSSPAPRETLPDAFEPALQALDDRLAETLVAGAPAGLEDRVFRASVGSLPAGRPTLVPAFLTSRFGWSQLAMAASLGLAFVVAAMTVMKAPGPNQAIASDTVLEIDWLREGPQAEEDRKIAHVLDTGALSSFDEVAGEMQALIDELEM
ncbi:MAG: hypothetical protein HKN62_09115 [Phycisphaerales bacterium]|nr:hypothetical protein [Phycisphaerales bacterium]